jgi:hypothetical protein
MLLSYHDIYNSLRLSLNLQKFNIAVSAELRFVVFQLFHDTVTEFPNARGAWFSLLLGGRLSNGCFRGLT